MSNKRYCFKCDKKLISAVSNGDSFKSNCPPFDALVFTTHGNFGSTIFDPFIDSSDRLEIMICDDCVKNNLSRVKKVITTKKITRKMVAFDPEKG